MKKKLIWAVIIVALFGLLFVFAASSDFRNLLRDMPVMKNVYAWAKDNFYPIYKLFRYDVPRKFVYVSILGITVSAVVSFVCLSVPAINDKTMGPIAVTQKPVLTKKDGHSSMIIVDENKGDNN